MKCCAFHYAICSRERLDSDWKILKVQFQKQNALKQFCTYILWKHIMPHDYMFPVSFISEWWTESITTKNCWCGKEIGFNFILWVG